MPKTDSSPWTYLSNHAHVLVCLERQNDLRVRELAALVGITERAVLRILSELQESGYLEVEKIGRRNRYRIDRKRLLRHHLESHRNIGDLLKLLK